MLKTITINTDTHRGVPIDTTNEIIKLKNNKQIQSTIVD